MNVDERVCLRNENAVNPFGTGFMKIKKREKTFRSEITLAFVMGAPKSPAARVIPRDDRLIPI